MEFTQQLSEIWGACTKVEKTIIIIISVSILAATMYALATGKHN